MPAGNLKVWLGQIALAVNDGADSDVPCGSCNACCRSSQFILVADTDVAARSVIPAELLFAAPGMPEGNHVMGYDSAGNCPMFRDNGCSIYAKRPQACRTYDCRIFAATGIDIAVDGHDEIAARVEQWQFDSDPDSDEYLAALRSAASSVAADASGQANAGSAMARALAAIRLATQT